MADPWGQLPDEPADCYASFLAYLALGPGRTLNRAYRACRAGSVAGDRAQKARVKASGWFVQTASKFDWRQRADAWDVANLRRHGARVVVKFVASLERIAERLLKAAGELKPGDKGWGQVLDTMDRLAEQLGLLRAAGLVDDWDLPQPCQSLGPAPAGHPEGVE